MTAEAPRRPAAGGLRFAALLLVAGLGLLWGGIALHLAQVRNNAEAAARQDADNLARSLEQNITRTIEGADQLLRFLQLLYARDPQGFDLFEWANAWQPADGLSVQLAHIGRDGRMRASSVDRTTRPIDLSDREHFRVHLNGGDRLFISRPVLGRVSQRWTIQFTRPMRLADGSFDGVLVLSMDTAYLSRFYESLRVGRSSVALVGEEDGIIRARAPFLDGVLGERVSETTLARTSGLASGSYRATGAFDGVERLYSFRAVPNYPLLVFVGLDLEHAFAGWQLDRRRSLLAGAVVSLALAMAALAMLRLNRAVARGQQALAQTVERLTQGVVMAGADGRVAVLNQRARDLLDLPPGLDQPGLPIARLLPRLGPVVAEAGNGRSHERRGQHGGLVETVQQVLPGGGTLLTSTDVTAQRALAEAQEHSRAAAEAANRAKTDFLANMSHEIRTPMNGVLGMMQLLRESPLDEQQRHWCETLASSGEALLRVVNDILDYSKLEAGRILLEPLPTDLPALVTEAAELMRATAEGKGLALETTIATAPPGPLLLDPTRLRQILLNLLSNAVKFSDAGTVGVTLDAWPEREGWVALKIVVYDQGIGIPASALPGLFARFNQADASSTRRYGGTGLGLAISRELARLMGGEMTVESAIGEGSSFTVTLAAPLAAAAQAAAAAPACSVPRELAILVAEDDAVNREVIAAFLAPAGHRLTFATNGFEAVAAARRERFDLVLMDIMMPGMDGPAATRAIRALPHPAAQVPILALTANAMSGDRERYLAAGMDGYVSKPINRTALQAELARVLGLGVTVAPAATPGGAQQKVPDDVAADFDALIEELKR